MKKHITLSFLTVILSVTISRAQITITNADMPTVNDTFRLSTTTDVWGLDASITGANHTWDFGFLTAQNQDVDTAASVSSTPFLYQFYFNNIILYPTHKADYAIKGDDFGFAGVLEVTDVYDYFKNSSSAFQNVGFGANINGLPASVRKIPVEVNYEFPLDYLDTYSNYSEFELEVPGLFSYKQKKNKTAEVDGWGQLILPLDTFDVLRVKFNIDITDSIMIDTIIDITFETPRPSETQYHWLAPGQDVPVLQMNESGGIITQIIYKDLKRVVGQHELQNEYMVNVFPNPATNSVTIKSDSPVELISIYDQTGRFVRQISPNASPVMATTHELPNGWYVLHIKTKNGNSIQKLVINR